MDEFFVLVYTLGVLFIGYWIGWQSRQRSALKLLNDLQMDMSNIEEEQLVTVARIEKHQGDFFLYDEKTGDFLAQGSSWSALQEVLLQRFGTKKTISIRRDDANKLGLDVDESV